MTDGGTGDEHDYEDDGPGFCFEAIPDIALGRKGCGPLDIALDTSVLINFMKFGRLMLDDGLVVGVDGVDEDVLALGNLLGLWMSRAIRFHLSPLNVEDAKRSLADDQREERERALFGLAAAITCHNGSNLDWSVRSDPGDQLEFDLDLRSKLQDIIAGLPNGYDRHLVREAVTQGRHVFLTCDKRLVNRSAKLAQFGLLVCLPSQLIAMFSPSMASRQWPGEPFRIRAALTRFGCSEIHTNGCILTTHSASSERFAARKAWQSQASGRPGTSCSWSR